MSSAAVSGANLWLEFIHKEYKERNWMNGVLFDDTVRNSWRAETEEGRARADRLSDYFWHPVQYYPVVIDSLIVPLAFDDWNWDVALQMTLINWQAIGLSFFLIRSGHYVIGRARPSLQGCSDDPDAEHFCSKRGSSFPSGHTGMAATGAGLACAHHQALPLYGGGWPEVIPCIVLNAGAVTNGVLRTIADKHWVTDVVVGYVIGLGVGYGIPYLFHYRSGGAPANVLGLFHGDFLPASTAIAPILRSDAWGLSIIGWQ